MCVLCHEFVSLFLYARICVCWRQVNSSLIQSLQGCVCAHDPLGFSAASLSWDSSPRVHQGMKGSLCSPSACEHRPFPLPFLCVESSPGTVFPSCTYYPNSLLFSHFLCILDAHLRHKLTHCFHFHTQNNFLHFALWNIWPIYSTLYKVYFFVCLCGD